MTFDTYFTSLRETAVDRYLEEENNETFSIQNKVIQTTVRLPHIKELVEDDSLNELFIMALKMSNKEDRVEAF